MADIIDLSNMNPIHGASQGVKRSSSAPFEISAIIVAKSVSAVFLQSLVTILKQPYLKEVIIIEQGNKNWILASLQRLAKEHPFIRIIHQSASKSLAQSYNLGATKAFGDQLLFLTGNMILPDNFFESLFAVSYQKQAPYIIGACNQKFDEKMKNQFSQMIFPQTAMRGMLGKAPMSSIKSVTLNCGAAHVSAVLPSCLMLSSDSFQSLKGFDAKISGEAAIADLCIRAHMLGGGVYEFASQGLHQFNAQAYYGTASKRARGWYQYYRKFYWQSNFGAMLRPLALFFWWKLKSAEFVAFMRQHLFKLRMHQLMRHKKANTG